MSLDKPDFCLYTLGGAGMMLLEEHARLLAISAANLE